MYVHTVGIPVRPEKSFGCPGTEGIGSNEQLIVGVANLGPLKEWQGPLTTESALQSLDVFPLSDRVLSCIPGNPHTHSDPPVSQTLE